MIMPEPYDLRAVTEAEADAWLEATEPLTTHIVTFQPEFRVEVNLPPWIDADEWLSVAMESWGDLLCEAPAWTENTGYAVVEPGLLGSIASIEDVP